jgi:hypothetical protein
MLGVFTTASMPTDYHGPEKNMPVKSKPGDFIFVKIEDVGTFWCELKNKTDNMFTMYTDYDGAGGALYCAMQLFTISYSYDYSFSAGEKNYVQEMSLKCVAKQGTPMHNHQTHSF